LAVPRGRNQDPPLLWYQGQVQTRLARRGGPLVLARAEGARVWDAEGRSYVDGRSGLWAVLVGYGRAEVAEAVARQLRTLSFAPLVDVASSVARELAAALTARLPEGLQTLMLVPTGSEAVDTAVKIARFYHYVGGERRRRIIISREYSAHGSTYAGSSLSDPDRGLLRGVGPGLPGVRFVAAPYRYRCPYCAQEPACTLACAAVVEDAITTAGPERVAAFLAEPVPGPGGVLVPPDGYWQRVREICDRYGVLLIADEVVTGFGRTGRWFACEHWTLVPDLLILGKGMASGYQPLAAVVMRRHVAERLAPRLVPHGFTFSGHPAACAAGLACLRIIEAEGLVERAQQMGAYLQARLRERLAASPVAGEVRGLGLMCAVELVEDRATRAPFRLGASGVDFLDHELRRRGVLCFADNPLIVAPPLVLARGDAEQLVEGVAEAVAMLVARRERSREGRPPGTERRTRG
jgi:putrescine aminotransferase